MTGLKGKKILVTRDFRQSKSFCRQIEALEAVAVVIPLIEIVHKINKAEQQEFIKNFAQIDWIILTSTNGVEHFFQAFSPEDYNFSEKKFAVVGKATAKCLKGYGFEASFIPTDYTGQCLVEEMAQHIGKNEQILFVKGKIAREVIPDYLTKEGYHFQVITVYDTVQSKSGEQKLIQMLEAGELDILTFTSPSTIRSFVQCLEGTNLLTICNQLTVAVIGPTSRDAAEAAGLKVDIMPSVYTISGMLRAINHNFE